MSLPENPVTRVDQYLNNIATGGGEIPEQPRTNIEQYLDYIATHGGGGGGSAASVSYDNTDSGLEAENVQDALDEIAEKASEEIITGDVGLGPTDPYEPTCDTQKDVNAHIFSKESEWDEKLDKDQGVAHAGDFLIVGDDGKITTQAFDILEGGSY